jgi:predicted phosphodiesterase
MNLRCLLVLALGGIFVSLAPPARGAAVAQWDFNGNLASSTGGPSLVSGATPPATAPGVMFTNVTIAGQPAQVCAFTRGTYFQLTHGFPPNGDGSLLNHYTLILDVMFPSRPTGWAVLWQTGKPASPDGEWFINPAGGVGISGNYGGSVPNGVWHRLALVVDTAAGTFTSFINGVQAQQNSGLTTDGRWALNPTAQLFADEDQENAAGFVNSAQLRDAAMTAADLAALGGPSAAGIPLPATPTLRLISPNGGEIFTAGSAQTVRWAAANPSGSVQIDLYRGDAFDRAIAAAPMRQSNYLWTIYPRLGDSNNFRLKLTALSFPGVEDFADGPFSVTGSSPPANPRFGQPLQTNGGFEQAFTGWQAVEGRPATLTASSGKGAPYSGVRFLHGGLNPAGQAVTRQEIDLLAAGFTAQDIDAGAMLDAEAWLRNWFGAGTFDDQVYCRVACVNDGGEELSSIRCLIAANDTWLRRAFSGRVPPGTRRLRLEIVGKHRRDLDNDSMADDVVVRLQESFADVTPQITKRPMLQDVRPDAMTMLWETDGNFAPHAVEWGRSHVAEHTLTRIETLQIDATHFVHRATLTGLQIETPYVYRVRSGTNATPVFQFRTAPKRDTPFAVAWWGDNHQGTAILRAHVANLLAHGPDLIGVAGDMVNSGNALNEWHDYWFKPLEHLDCAQTRPVMFARGNHDGEHALAYAYSALPGNEAWFAFDYGNTRFIFLDSETDTSGSPEQFAWLQAELARPETQRAAFRVVCFHRPPWVNLWNGGGHVGETWVRNDWVPLFAQRSVDLVIGGHAHNYNRGASNGVTYVISGGGGGTLDLERVAFWPLYTVEYSRYHYCLMEVDGRTLLWRTFDPQNQLLDEFTLHSRVPELALHQSNPPGAPLTLVQSGRGGVTYHLQASTNLSHWTTIATNMMPAAGTPAVTNLVPVDSSSRFFRSQVRP